MKLLGEVRAVERAVGNPNARQEPVEKRTFKLNVKPASKPDSYYGYGTMQFILHGRELEDSGLDLGTKVDMYLVPEGTAKPDSAELDDARRQLYETEQALAMERRNHEDLKRRSAETERTRWDAGEKMKALQQENIRLTTELLALRGAVGEFKPPPTMLEGGAWTGETT